MNKGCTPPFIVARSVVTFKKALYNLIRWKKCTKALKKCKLTSHFLPLVGSFGWAASGPLPPYGTGNIKLKYITYNVPIIKS